MKKKKAPISSPEITNLNQKLSDLNQKKLDLLRQAVSYQEEFNSLAANVESAEDWLYGLPINSAKDLEVKGERRTNLGCLKKRSKLRKQSSKTLEEVDQIDNQLNNVKLDLLHCQLKELMNFGER